MLSAFAQKVVKTVPTDNQNENFVYAMCASADGGYLLVGGEDAVNGGYYAKFNSDLVKQWDGTVSVGAFEEFLDCTPISGGGYLAIGLSESVNDTVEYGLVSVIDASGQNTSNKTYKDPRAGWNIELFSICPSYDNNFMAVGYTFNTAGINSLQEYILFKLDSNGDTIWTKRQPVGSNPLVPSYIIQSSDGGFYIAGNDNLTNNQGDLVLLKLDANGDELWRKVLINGASKSYIAFKALATSDGALLGYSAFNPGANTFEGGFAKANLNGDFEWEKALNGVNDTDAAGYQAVATDDGGYILAGYTASQMGNLLQYAFQKVNAQGQLIWSYNDPNTSTSDGAVDILPSSSTPGEYVFAGFDEGTASSTGLIGLLQDTIAITSIASYQGLTISIYPNPTAGEFQLPFSGGYLQLQLVDMLGRKVSEIRNLGGQRYAFTSTPTAGQYLLIATDGKGNKGATTLMVE